MSRDRYYSHTRSDLLGLLPKARHLRVLEVGCGEGRTGAFLKEEGIAREVVGIETVEEPAEAARARLDEVLLGDAETLELPANRRFDLLLFADVLEHLRDPWGTLRRYTAHLEPGGWVVSSTPNIAYWRTAFDLFVRGRWRYQDSGIMDRTHLRFFTVETAIELHRQAELVIESVGHTAKIAGKSLWFNRLTRWKLESRFVRQNLIRSRKPGRSPVEELLPDTADGTRPSASVAGRDAERAREG